MPVNEYITGPGSLVTTKAETRAGFIAAALEKNRQATPYIESARAFRQLALKAKSPKELLDIPEIRKPLTTAAGLSDKSLKYFNEDDITNAIEELIKNFLEPAGDYFIDEAVYRYILIRGDSLGGSMRNIVGAVAQQKLVRNLLSVMNICNIDYKWLDNRKKKVWLDRQENDCGIENDMKAISWMFNGQNRTLAFNLKIPVVNKNVDICLFDCDFIEYNLGKIVNNNNRAVMFGELKGGIDPAGADEHWKTANSALNRIRAAFDNQGLKVKTSFVGAAIECSMAEEIYNQLLSEELSYAANLTHNNQLIEYCNWLVNC